MGNKLVIVESPAKAKTLSKILGKGYIIKASMGHVRDLPPYSLGISVDNDFEPQYRPIRERKSVVAEIKQLANNASAIYLATDPDREGEAISWHLVKAANLEKDKIPLRRVTFHEITKEAVEEAFNNPRTIDAKMVEAQQARRILDRLVGYKLSPLLWKKVLRGLSAGRVQSVAVRLVVDREREILAFVYVEYWTIEAEVAQKASSSKGFRVSFVGLAGEGKMNIANKETCDQVLSDLKASDYSVAAIQKKAVPRNPAAPFITSTLQQEAYRKLHFTAKKTMLIAQQLYEGMPIGEEGDTGLITYMRTDSTHMATTAVDEIREYVHKAFSREYLPKSPRVFTKKVKMAQEAHEAIRPTKAQREPEKIKSYLNKDQFQLYDLIWKRAIASQMSAALYDTVTVDINAANKPKKKDYLLQSKASSLRFPGFMALYIEGKDEEKDEYEEGTSTKIPPLTEKELLRLVELFPEQFFTQPPPRYTEATLIKSLEQKGIGRPSTYAPIISTIVDRGYVYKDSGKLKPEDIGMIVNDLLVKSFPNIVDFNFTANMENALDEIAKGKMKWISVIKSFYEPFEKELADAQENIQKIVITSEESCPECGKPMVVQSDRHGKFLVCNNPECKGNEVTNEPCPECGKPMVMKFSRYGKFLACSNYPECKGKRSLNAEGVASDKAAGVLEVTDQLCPKCGKPMVQKSSRYGKFLACSNYPKCKGKKSLSDKDLVGDKVAAESKATNEPCPKCGKNMVFRKGRFSTFLTCPDYPKCSGKQSTNRNPDGQEKERAKPEITDETCDECGLPMVVRSGRFGKFLSCSGYPKCKATKKILASSKAEGAPDAASAA